MLSFPGSKINLGLRIVGKRKDGFHDLQSVFYPLQLSDILEIVPAETYSFSQTGLPIPGDPNLNIVKRAFDLFQKNTNCGNVKIHLHKVVPVGAGIGGGSANATATLVLLNKIFDQNISHDQLHDWALELGSDCPFFLFQTPKSVTGRGEHLEDCSVSLDGYYIKLIFPNIHISTADAFANLELREASIHVSDWSKPSDWKETLFNDFEEGAFRQNGLMSEIKDSLYSEGAVYASMTGSGSSIYGIFKERPKRAESEYFVWVSKL